MNTFTLPKLHNAMWPGLVGKGDGPDQQPAISLDQMLQMTISANYADQKFDGVDLFIGEPHINPKISADDLWRLGDKIANMNLTVGSLVPAIWPGAGGGSAMSDGEGRAEFLKAVTDACRIGKILRAHGVRKYGVIRVDSAEFGLSTWSRSRMRNTELIVETFGLAAEIARSHGERLAAEMEICWAGMHSCYRMLEVLETVNMPEVFGVQIDLAHVHTAMLGYNAPGDRMLDEGYTEEQFYAAYAEVAKMLRPWTIDLHIAQNDGTVHGEGDHAKTGKHCLPNDPAGKLDIVKCAGYWLQGASGRGIEHICWDGCMLPNATLEYAGTWDSVLRKMVEVRDTHGWS